MKIRIWQCLTLILAAGLFAPNVALCDGENILVNAGFEKCVPGDVAKEKYAGWYVNIWSAPGTVELVTDASRAHSGGQCILFTPKTPGKAEAHIYQTVPVKSGGKYVFKVWAMAGKDDLSNLANPPRIRLVAYQYQGKDMKYLGKIQSNFFPVSDKWQEFTWEFTPTQARADKVGCAIAVIDAPLFIDDASLTLKN